MARAGLGAEWTCAFANDFDEKKAKSYSDNWGGGHLVVDDIASLVSNQLPGQADLAWASFPCQDLSLAGNRAGLRGNRSGTLWSFVSLMGQLKTEGRAPRIIALENVLGAVTSNDGLDFAAMVAAIADLGYRVGAMVIDAVCFVPQSRPRLFVVAVDDSICIPEDCVDTMLSGGWHPPTLIRAYGQIARTLQHQWVWWNLPAADPRRTNLGDLIEDFPNGVKWNTEQETGGLLQMMSPTNRQKVLQAQFGGRVKVGTVYKRTRHGVQQAEVRFDGVAGCLRTPGGGSSRQTILMVDGPQIRSRLLSPREAARLMGLSDSYALPERYNDAYRLAGDGVVVPVVAYLTENLFNRLTQQRTGSERGRRTQAA